MFCSKSLISFDGKINVEHIMKMFYTKAKQIFHLKWQTWNKRLCRLGGSPGLVDMGDDS